MSVARVAWWAAAAIAALVGVLPRPAAAQPLRSEVDARRVGVQDQVRFTITVEGPALPEQVALPPMTNLRVLGGPSVSTQMSFINGRSSQSQSWTWVLQPAAVGRAEIGALRIRLGNEDASAPAIAIEVVAGSAKPPQARRPRSPLDEDPFGGALGRGQAAEPQVFVETRPSRTSLFVGEPLLITYWLYTRSSISGLQFVEAPQYSGFWAEDLESPERPQGEPATVEGVQYRRFPVAMKLLFPTKAGKLSIPPVKLRIGLARVSFFDAGGVVERSTKPVALDVKPLPDELGFAGAVGRFQASATVDKTQLALGEAATLRFKVEGTGNLKWIERGPAPSVPGAKVYPPQLKSALQTRTSGIAGSRTWEYVLVPETAGALEIPALEFTYFDPAARRIARSVTAPIALTVQAGPGLAPSAPPPGAAIATRGGPLALRSDLDLGAVGTFSGTTVGVVALSALLVHGALWGAMAVRGRLRRGAGRISAPRDVRGALGVLSRIGSEGLSKEKAAGQIEKAIHGVFGTLDGDDDERGREVRALLEEVHAVRYAPQLGDYSERLRELAARAAAVVRRWA